MSENKGTITHGFKRAPSLFERQTALGWAVIVALVALLGVFYLMRGSEQVISGYEMLVMMDDLSALQDENTYLESEIAAAQSVERLQLRAVGLGFVPADPDSIEYLLVEDYPPQPGQTQAPTPPPVLEPPNQLARWRNGLFQAFSGWTSGSAGGE